jgi:hypothetical protein
MLPIWKDKLSIEKITDRWSQEIQPPTSREELLDFFETAWWRGRWKTDGPLTPLALLKSMYRSARERDLTTLVFVTKEDEISEGIELADGGLLFDGNELERPAILVLVPSNDPETWTEASCAAAFEVLSQTPSRKYYRSIQFLMMEIDRHQFVRLLAAHGLDLPKFWRPPISEPPELEKEAHISIGCKPPGEDQSGPGASKVRRRGRKPGKFERTKEAMRHDIREGRLNPASLREKLEKDLAEAYGVSRDTARKARDAVLVGEAMRRDIREGRRTAASLGAMREKELGETYGVSPDIASKARTAVLSEIVEEPNRDK